MGKLLPSIFSSIRLFYVVVVLHVTSRCRPNTSTKNSEVKIQASALQYCMFVTLINKSRLCTFI